MKKVISIFFIVVALISCNHKKEVSSINPENWKARTIQKKPGNSLDSGKTYLSVYSQIYGMTEHRIYNLTATISMRNTNNADTVFILNAEYYDTKGDLIRSYFEKPIFLAPMETVEIVIDEMDKEGGTGANFLFEWKTKPSSNETFFEGVMISTSGQQGLSFTTQGIKIE